jgi:hypothetical protein
MTVLLGVAVGHRRAKGEADIYEPMPNLLKLGLIEIPQRLTSPPGGRF